MKIRPQTQAVYTIKSDMHRPLTPQTQAVRTIKADVHKATTKTGHEPPSRCVSVTGRGGRQALRSQVLINAQLEPFGGRQGLRGGVAQDVTGKGTKTCKKGQEHQQKRDGCRLVKQCGRSRVGRLGGELTSSWRHTSAVEGPVVVCNMCAGLRCTGR